MIFLLLIVNNEVANNFLIILSSFEIRGDGKAE